MKKIIYLFILVSFAFTLNSQNIIKEIKYLKAINKQDIELIEDNLRNAEICAFKIIQNPDSFKNTGHIFFNELAKSYYLTENYEFSLLSYYRQRCFFPIKEDAEESKYFFNSSEQIKKGNFKLFEEIYNISSQENIPSSYNEKFELFLKASYQSGFENSEKFEEKYSDLYRKKFSDNNIPYWIKQHNFYSKIEIKPKHRKDFYSFTKKENEFFIPKFLTKKQKHKICKKALKYYLHIKNKEMVKKYASFCKENNIKYCLRAKFIR